MKCLIAGVEDQYYALPIEQVEYIAESVQLQTPPKKIKHVIGLMNFHGEPINVIDMRKYLDLSEGELDFFNSKIVICKFKKKKIGLLFSSVESVREIESEVDIFQGKQVLYFDIEARFSQEDLNV